MTNSILHWKAEDIVIKDTKKFKVTLEKDFLGFELFLK